MTSTKITKESIISSYHVLFWAVSQRVASESWEQIQHHRWMPGCKLQVAAEALSASPVDFASLQDVILFTYYRCLKRSLKHFKTTVSIVRTQNYHQLSSTSQLKIFDWLLNFWWNKSIIDIQVATKMAEFVIASPGGSDSIGWRHQQARDPGIHCANPGQQKGSKRIKILGFTIHKKIAKFHQFFSVFAYFSLAVWLYLCGGNSVSRLELKPTWMDTWKTLKTQSIGSCQKWLKCSITTPKEKFRPKIPSWWAECLRHPAPVPIQTLSSKRNAKRCFFEVRKWRKHINRIDVPEIILNHHKSIKDHESTLAHFKRQEAANF